MLLASDGLTDLVEDDRIEEILVRHDDDAAAMALVDEALALGGRDNVTCLLGTIIEGPRVVSDGQLWAPCATPGTSSTPRRSGCRTPPEGSGAPRGRLPRMTQVSGHDSRVRSPCVTDDASPSPSSGRRAEPC